MISLIICSRKKDITTELKQNIQSTIGVEYELVVIDNSKNKYTIFSAYNEGVKRAKYPYICFMHEDILYHSQNWGERVVEHFNDAKCGMIGVFGGHYMTSNVTWPFEFVNSGIILQGDRTGFNKNKYSVYLTKADNNIKNEESKIQVVAVDGLWFCIPKSLFNKIYFDEKYYSGFHAYDLDISMQVNSLNLQVCVVFDILIEHFSLGNFDDLFLFEVKKFLEKWKDKLPILKGLELSEQELKLKDEYGLMIMKDRITLDSLNMRVYNISNSKAYRIGKLILKPFSIIRQFLKK